MFELKVNDGKVVFRMRTGKDFVKSSMLQARAKVIMSTAKEVTYDENSEFPICVDDTYFFEGVKSWEDPELVEKPVETVDNTPGDKLFGKRKGKR